MMSKTTFKLTFIAASLLAAQSASAAIYNVVEVTPKITANQYYGSAIESKEIDATTDPKDPTQLGCFGTNQCDEKDYVLAGDTRNGTEGIPYKDEVPFKVDNTFTYLDRDDLKRYCYNQLGYDTCEGWADDQWYGGGNKSAGGLERERDAFSQANYKSNASAFNSKNGILTNIPSDSVYKPGGIASPVDSTKNVVVTNFGKATPTAVIGITSSGYYDVNRSYALAFRQRGFYDTTQLLPKQDGAIVEKMGRTFAYDSFEYNGSTYAVGSASIAAFDTGDDNKEYNNGSLGHCKTDADPAASSDCQNFAFATQAYTWNLGAVAPATASGVAVSGWVGQATTSPNHKKAAAQGSARTAAIAQIPGNQYDTLPVLGGFNTRSDDKNLLMEAAIFYPTKSAGFSVGDNAWSSVFINGARVKDGSDYIYSNSLVKAMNRNLIAIGETKRSGRYSDSGAANNRLFYTDAATGSASKSPNAVYLTGDIFFSSAGGEANDINNFNEVVGSIDAEKDRESGGKQRRRRGFIDPLNLTGTNPDRLAIFQGKSWWLDNLTNGDNADPKNNQYRIINATGINDDGVISATAIKCEGGYDNTTHNSYCGDGNSKEKVVAVKLVPIAGTTSADITARSGDNPKVERAGSLGVWVLGLLGFIGFRRKSSLKK
ncbi:DUF3466 family protein [Vibrio hibernica]|uniref:DUF3466 family protein n=1 Tax=Vibrio hibernica TaxID=2587465 RepID=UPI001E2878FC|nr:DUF3466 family protein [Vibrio hibernica]